MSVPIRSNVDSFRSYLALIGLGAAVEAVLLLYFVRQFPLLRYYRRDSDLGSMTGYSHPAFIQFVGFISLLLVLMALAWAITARKRDHLALSIVLALGGLFAVTLAFVYPITAIDLYAYIDQSLVLVYYHHNPIITPPAAFASDSLMQLSDGWQGSPSPYGPLGTVIDALPALVFGRNLLANLLALKLMFGAMGVGEGYMVYSIVRRHAPRWAVSGALLVAWNPLIFLEVSINGHNDIAMMLFAILGIASLGEDELTLGPVLLVASVLIKYTTVILLPPAILYAYFRKPPGERLRYLITTGGACVAVAVLGYLPFWAGLDTVSHLLSQDQRHLSSFSSVVPGLLPSIDPSVATLVGRLLFIPIYVRCLWLATRDFESLLRAGFLAVLGLLALGVTNFESWYVIWPVVLAAAVPRLAERLSMVLMAYGSSLLASFFGYVWVWNGLSPQGFTIADTVSYLLTFVPASVGLVVLGWPRPAPARTKPEDSTTAEAVGI